MAEVVTRLRAAGCVFAEDEARLLLEAAGTETELDTMVGRREQGLPLEQILGWARFCGLRIAVEPGVFVPRGRTELLVRQAAALAPKVVVDMCCGTGAVGAALAALRPGIELYAVDIDPVEVACARRNLPNARVFAGDLYEPLPAALRGRVDVVVANAPYVPTDAVAMMPPEARDHEPMVALDGGKDGLDIARRVIQEAPEWLAPGGHVLIETSERQAPELVAASPLPARVTHDEELWATVIVAGPLQG
jgi:release factor glutamine methyltransferase